MQIKYPVSEIRKPPEFENFKNTKVFRCYHDLLKMENYRKHWEDS